MEDNRIDLQATDTQPYGDFITDPPLVPTDGKKKNVRLLAIILLALLLIGAGAGLFFCSQHGGGWFDSNAITGSYDGKTEEEILAELNGKVEEGMMGISISTVIPFDSANAEGEARIENMAVNHVDQKVTITLDDTEEVIYQSGAIAPGQYIPTITLDKKLEPGTYDATAMFVGYDQKTHEETGRAGARVKIIIES